MSTIPKVRYSSLQAQKDFQVPTAVLPYDLTAPCGLLSFRSALQGCKGYARCTLCYSASWAALVLAPRQARCPGHTQRSGVVQRCRLRGPKPSLPRTGMPDLPHDCWDAWTNEAKEKENDGHPMKLLRCAVQSERCHSVHCLLNIILHDLSEVSKHYCNYIAQPRVLDFSLFHSLVNNNVFHIWAKIL